MIEKTMIEFETGVSYLVILGRNYMKTRESYETEIMRLIKMAGDMKIGVKVTRL